MLTTKRNCSYGINVRVTWSKPFAMNRSPPGTANAAVGPNPRRRARAHPACEPQLGRNLLPIRVKRGPQGRCGTKRSADIGSRQYSANDDHPTNKPSTKRASETELARGDRYGSPFAIHCLGWILAFLGLGSVIGAKAYSPRREGLGAQARPVSAIGGTSVETKASPGGPC